MRAFKQKTASPYKWSSIEVVAMYEVARWVIPFTSRHRTLTCSQLSVRTSARDNLFHTRVSILHCTSQLLNESSLMQHRISRCIFSYCAVFLRIYHHRYYVSGESPSLFPEADTATTTIVIPSSLGILNCLLLFSASYSSSSWFLGAENKILRRVKITSLLKFSLRVILFYVIFLIFPLSHQEPG
jgi:hypothetical protein